MNAQHAIGVIQYGLGPIGAAIARLAASRGGLELVGGVDIDPHKADRPLGEVIGLPRLSAPRVWADASAAVAALRPRLALHSTASSLPLVMDQLLGLLEAGVSVISTCEELAYPFERYPEQSERLDAVARANDARILGTGVNPGFVMDTLVFVLSGVAARIERITVNRTVDASRRRLPLQQKIGAALDLDEFGRRAREGRLRHVGLEESLWMVARAVGWRVDRIESTLEPIIAERERRSTELVARPGQAAGVHQRAIGWVGHEPRLVYDLRMFLEAEDPADEIRIDGEPPLLIRVPNGIHGDTATAAIVVNAIPRVLAAPPGLLTMLDIPPPVGKGAGDAAA